MNSHVPAYTLCTNDTPIYMELKINKYNVIINSISITIYTTSINILAFLDFTKIKKWKLVHSLCKILYSNCYDFQYTYIMYAYYIFKMIIYIDNFTDVYTVYVSNAQETNYSNK